jgi:hypothetical protein
MLFQEQEVGCWCFRAVRQHAWVILLGSLIVVLNMVPAYQVRPQPQHAYLVCVLYMPDLFTGSLWGA